MQRLHGASPRGASGARHPRRNPARAARQDARMDTTRRAAIAALTALAAVPAARAQDGTITGTATYRERMALPPGAVLEVELRDVSRADAPADLLGSARVAATGQVPIRFALRFDPARIDPRAAYAVAARLTFGGRLRFRSDAVHPVLTRGAGTHADILLVRAAPRREGDAAAPMDEGGAAAPTALLGPAWVVEDIAGRGVVDRLRSDITFGADGRAHGSGGCNRFTGGYTLAGPSLRFDAMAQTNMACADAAMDQEARFHAALAQVRAWRMEDTRLHLLDGRGATVVRLARG
jgi:putative lipoprotein